MVDWYPHEKEELNSWLDSFLDNTPKIKHKEIQGIIVPHAGYSLSGKIAGKAYSLLKSVKQKTAIILAPSHYLAINGATSHNDSDWITPLGKIKINQRGFPKENISQEHAIDNQIPFLQKLGFKEITPIMIGELTSGQAGQIAEKLSSIEGIFVISSDLSHFLPYDEAIRKDKETINAVESLNSKKLSETENYACGIFPLLVFAELAKIKGWHPQLIDYKNSGDITGDKTSVVGYASFAF